MARTVWDVAEIDLLPYPRDLYMRTSTELKTNQPAGAALLPWQRPCRINARLPPMKLRDSSQPVQRENVMSWIELSIADMVPQSTPSERKISPMMQW